MPRPAIKNIAALVITFILAWMSFRWLLPLVLPFLLGILLALTAEPAVGFLCRRLRLPRALGAGIGVAATLALLAAMLVLLTAALLRELAALAGAVPNLEQTASQGLASLENFLSGLALRMPQGVQPILLQLVSSVFSGGNALVDKLASRLPGMATALFSHVPGSALTIGTGILSGFMVSARLPRLKQRLGPLKSRLQRYIPMLQQVKRSLLGWLKAQLTLSGLSFCIVGLGLLILGVPYAPLWALLIALVDAIPILGTGTILLPWMLIGLIQGNQALALGLGGIYAAALLSRSVLEPRLLGKHLGIDPLMTLIALYIGYQLWGFGGMLLAPMLCAAATELTQFQQ